MTENTQKLTVNVVVPAFNRKHSLLAALESLESQSYQGFSVTVVDDGSTDRGGELATSWIDQHALAHRYQVLRLDRNQGAATARNRGMNHGPIREFTAFLDSDDLWPACYLERMVTELAAAPQAVAATSDRLFVNKHDQTRILRASDGIARNPTSWIFRDTEAITSATVIRSAVLKTISPFSPKLATGQDTDFFLRLSLLGPWLYVPGPAVTVHRGPFTNGDTSSLSSRFTDSQERWARLFETFITRHGGWRKIPVWTVSKVLATRFEAAASQHELNGHYRRSIVCLAKASQWQPLLTKSKLMIARQVYHSWTKNMRSHGESKG